MSIYLLAIWLHPTKWEIDNCGITVLTIMIYNSKYQIDRSLFALQYSKDAIILDILWFRLNKVLK